MRVKELSLRPYHGRLFVAKEPRAYERAHFRLFKEHDWQDPMWNGRFSGEKKIKDNLAYLVWASSPHTMAHELSHVILSVFSTAGIDPREAHGEPFCYMLSQLMLEAK